MARILAGRIAVKGLVAASLGLLVGTIGEGASAGALRMSTYDIPYLVDGLKLVIVGLAVFAVPEIVALLRQDKSISDRRAIGGGWMDGVYEVGPIAGSSHEPRWIDFVWLSFSTLTTAGYGDLAPISPWANALCTLEALCGILFPATLIARIASLPATPTFTGPPSATPL